MKTGECRKLGKTNEKHVYLRIFGFCCCVSGTSNWLVVVNASALAPHNKLNKQTNRYFLRVKVIEQRCSSLTFYVQLNIVVEKQHAHTHTRARAQTYTHTHTYIEGKQSKGNHKRTAGRGGGVGAMAWFQTLAQSPTPSRLFSVSHRWWL